MYREGTGDLTNDFLLFNSIFKTSIDKEVSNIKNYGDIVRTVGVSNLVSPDLGYKISSKSLNVNYNKEISDISDKKIYVLQDCTVSMKRYDGHLKMIKGFILNQAFKNDYEVVWLLVNDRIIDEQVFNKDNLNEVNSNNMFYGIRVNTSKILTEDRFAHKKVIIITDGTDQFNFEFNTKTTQVNMISFNDNVELRNIIANHGRFFKITR